MKLLIVDDHPVVREGVAAVLRQAGPGTDVLTAAGSDEGLTVADRHPDIDAVFVDLAMPGVDGMSTIVAFGKRHPGLPVIVLSSSEDPQDVRRACASGALGYVPKSASPQTLLSALHFVLAGNVYIPPLMLQESAPVPSKPDPAAEKAGVRLTERQVEVLRLLCDGLANKEIGRRLGLADKTVKAHITVVFRALGVVNRTQAANAARLAGLL
jgi:two-component system nitrate/nitrite response regulator NarL